MGRGFELLVAGAFVLFVGAVLAAAGIELLLLALERIGRRAAPKSAGRLRYRRAVLAATGLGVLCFAWGLVEPYWPEITRTRIESRLVPPGARPVRIVHLSDFHCEGKARIEERLPALVAAERPDAIVFTGDCINDPAGLPVLRRLLEDLSKVAPVFVVGGNWDAWYFTRLERFTGTGVRQLDGRSERILAGTTPVNFAGIFFGHETRMDAALADVSPAELCVFAYHTPDLALDLPERGVDLYLCGHTHGGQVRLPFYGALLTLARYGKRFEAGLYEVDGMRLYVTRGIGMEGHVVPPVRFLCRPEISVLEIGPPGSRPQE